MLLKWSKCFKWGALIRSTSAAHVSVSSPRRLRSLHLRVSRVGRRKVARREVTTQAAQPEAESDAAPEDLSLRELCAPVPTARHSLKCIAARWQTREGPADAAKESEPNRVLSCAGGRL